MTQFKKTVNILIVKQEVPRILPVRDKILNLIFSLRKERKYVFAITENPANFSIELTHFTQRAGIKDAEIIRNIVIAYLSEKSYIKNASTNERQ